MTRPCINCGNPATRTNAIGEHCCGRCGETYDALDKVMEQILEIIAPPEQEFTFAVAPELQDLGYPSDEVSIKSCCLLHASQDLEKQFTEMFGEQQMLAANERASARIARERASARLN